MRISAVPPPASVLLSSSCPTSSIMFHQQLRATNVRQTADSGVATPHPTSRLGVAGGTGGAGGGAYVQGSWPHTLLLMMTAQATVQPIADQQQTPMQTYTQQVSGKQLAQPDRYQRKYNRWRSIETFPSGSRLKQHGHMKTHAQTEQSANKTTRSTKSTADGGASSTSATTGLSEAHPI